MHIELFYASAQDHRDSWICRHSSKTQQTDPHAPAYALTPFSHTHLWPKRIRLSLVPRQSYSLASQVKEGGAVFPVGPKHRAHFMARTAGTHIGLSIFCISPAFGSVRTVRNAVGFGVQTGLNQQDDVFLWVCLSWGWWVSDVLYQWRSLGQLRHCFVRVVHGYNQQLFPPSNGKT